MNVPGNVNEINAFADLLDVIGTAPGRKAVVTDPQTSFQSWDALPQSVRDIVGDLSRSELRVLAHLNEAVRDAGLTVDVGGRTHNIF